MMVATALAILIFTVSSTAGEKPFTFAAYGDNREGSGDAAITRTLIDRIVRAQPAFVLHMGDLVHDGNNEGQWNAFFRDVRARMDVAKLKPAKGNHDRGSEKRFESYFPYGSARMAYYAFTYGGACFVSTDSTADYAPESAQYRFIAGELEKCRMSWPVIVYMHHPPFSAGEHGDTEKVKKNLVPLFEKYGVDIVFAGHDHTYQRLNAKNGVAYVVTGGGGAPLYKVTPRDDVKVAASVYHYMVVRVEGSRMTITAKDVHGKVIDTFEIKK